MRYELLVEGRKMVLRQDSEDAGKPSDDGPHTAYAVKRHDVHKDLAAFRRLAENIKADHVCELFGGSGWHSAAIQDLVHPSSHWVLEIDNDCINSIRDSLPDVNGLKVFKTDSYAFAADKLAAAEFDWVHADFNKFTLMRGLKNKLYSKSLAGIFGSKARKVVTITDSSLYGFKFPKNLEAYTKAFGYEVRGQDSYYAMASRWYYETYGFSIAEVITWDEMSSMYRLVRAKPGRAISISKQTRPASVKVVSG